MAEDKNPGVTIEASASEEQEPESSAPEMPGAPTPPGPEALTVEEQLILEHEGRAALSEMGEAFPDAPELPSMTIPEQPAPEQGPQVVLPGMEGPRPRRAARSGRSPRSRRRNPAGAAAPAQGRLPWGKRGDRLSGPGPALPVPEPPVRRPGRCGDAGTCFVGQGWRRPPARPGASPCGRGAMRS